jgi:hypothetical protein
MLIKTNWGLWGLGIGDWGLGIGPIPNPQSPSILSFNFVKKPFYFLKTHKIKIENFCILIYLVLYYL